MPQFSTDQILWYNVGVWGQLGYGVPNFGNDPATLNAGIHYLTSVIGRNLSAVMHHADADLRVPPSINTLTRLHKLITRARTILASRDVGPADIRMEAQHSSPAQQDFLIYPVPYFMVRNPWLKEYCGLVLNALSEAFQHTENRLPFEISTAFSGLVGQYLQRVYRLMATELFGVTTIDATKPDFTLKDTDLAGYDPAKYFTSTELIDTVSPLQLVPTEDDIRILTDGIPASLLVGVQKYPSGGSPAAEGQMATGATISNPSTVAGAQEAWRAAPGV